MVDGVQAANASPGLNPDEKALAIRGALMQLTTEQLLQSINEQFGDFLKDFAHYGNQPAFLFRSAKYVQRLFEAVSILSMKCPLSPMPGQSALQHFNLARIDRCFARKSGEILNRINLKTEGLVAVRKGDKKFASDAERDAYCKAEAKTYFGAVDGEDLTQRIVQMVLQINVQVRSGLCTSPSIKDVRAYFKAIQL